MENAWPTTINFKPKFDQGALLTIVNISKTTKKFSKFKIYFNSIFDNKAWSNGRLQHVPLYFNKMAEDQAIITQPISNLSYNLTSY